MLSTFRELWQLSKKCCSAVQRDAMFLQSSRNETAGLKQDRSLKISVKVHNYLHRQINQCWIFLCRQSRGRAFQQRKVWHNFSPFLSHTHTVHTNLAGVTFSTDSDHRASCGMGMWLKGDGRVSGRVCQWKEGLLAGGNEIRTVQMKTHSRTHTKLNKVIDCSRLWKGSDGLNRTSSRMWTCTHYQKYHWRWKQQEAQPLCISKQTNSKWFQTTELLFLSFTYLQLELL